MLVRHAIAILSLLFVLGSHARAEQEPTFALTVKPPVGGKPQHHKLVEGALRAREPVLKPALLAKTKAYPASRLSIKIVVEVVAKGGLEPKTIEVSYRNAKGPIIDDSIKTIVSDSFTKTPKMPAAIGTKVELAISILQP